ncbi:MAG: deoxyribose-phosphate aldolase [Chloroflexi bacterium]|nr:MAG: deoxyribose-phosphate aldolase [Chloroflexota bacterium]
MTEKTNQIDSEVISLAREVIKDPAEPGEVSPQHIDHTLLKPETTLSQIMHLCLEAVRYGFKIVSVNPVYVPLCADQLSRSSVKVGSVVGFPFGASTTRIKVNEAKEAIRQGAREIDMVIFIGGLKAGQHNVVLDDISKVADVVHAGDSLLKVAIETSLLTDDEKIQACKLAKEAGADFVKTSTGFSTGGAVVADVRQMREVIGPEMGLKAAGGIRTLAAAEKMITAGANRIGTSAGVKIIEEALCRRVKSAVKTRLDMDMDDQEAQAVIQRVLEIET